MGSVDDRGIVVDLGDFASFMGNFGARREAGGNTFVEFLAFEGGDHSERSFWARSGVIGNGGEEDFEAPGRGGVVEALFEGFVVFHTAEDVHAVGMQGMDGGVDVLDAKFFEHEICGEIAAHGNHEFAQFGEGASFSLRFVEIDFRVVGRIEFVGRVIDDGTEFVVDHKRISEFNFAGLDLSVQLDHDGNFHSAGGVKGVLRVVEPCGFPVESAEGDADFGM